MWTVLVITCKPWAQGSRFVWTMSTDWEIINYTGITPVDHLIVIPIVIAVVVKLSFLHTHYCNQIHKHLKKRPDTQGVRSKQHTKLQKYQIITNLYYARTDAINNYHLTHTIHTIIHTIS